MPENRALQDLLADASCAGQRLDHVLASWQGCSLRAARRLLGDGRVFVNGKKARAGQYLCAGDRVTLSPANDTHEAGMICAMEAGASCGVRVLSRDGDYAFLEKPALLHTTALAGRDNANVERLLPALLPEQPFRELLQRLDFETSGLLCCALSPDAAARFRALEARGAVAKQYLCVIEGYPEKPLVCASVLAQNGPAVRVLGRDEADPARTTLIVPLKLLDAGDLKQLGMAETRATLAGCLIHRGMRHQIRAHAAHLGYPLLLDSVYGTKRAGVAKQNGHFLLHHARLAFDRHVLESLPDWLGKIQGGTDLADKWFAQSRLVK